MNSQETPVNKHIRTLACLYLVMLAASSALCAEKATKTKPDSDAPIVWHDCTKIGVEGKGWTDTPSYYDRLPGKAKGMVTKAVWGHSHSSAGLCVRFATDAASFQVRWTLLGAKLAMPHMPATGTSGIDLYVKEKAGQWRFVGLGDGRPTASSNTSTFALPGGRQYLLYLPLYNGVRSVEIGVPEGRTIAACPVPSRKPIVFYGTSITQGGCASRPGMAFTAIVGRRLDATVVNLGFSGSGKMEPEMADLLAELDPSVFVLDCLWNMKPEQVAERVEPFVGRLRQARPDTPILLAEDSSFQNVCPTEKGVVLRAAYEKLKAAGVKNLHFLPSRDMLGTDGEGTVDGCHPNDLGMARLADAFAKALIPIVQESTK
jgi:lysophospholipase L1-like esterase